MAIVVSEDRAEPGRGFETHAHRDQDVAGHVAALSQGVTLPIPLAPARRAWLHLARGRLRLEDGTALGAGDGAAITDSNGLEVTAIEEADLVLFDLA